MPDFYQLFHDMSGFLIPLILLFFVVVVMLIVAIFRVKTEAIEQTKILESIEHHLKFQNDKIRKQEHETLASL